MKVVVPFEYVMIHTRSKTSPGQEAGGVVTFRAAASSGIVPWCQQTRTLVPAYLPWSNRALARP